MEIRHLRSFLSLAETLHFGRTATRLHVSQSALTLQIQSLEGELGLRLFDRSRRGTTITEAGQALRCEAAVALSQLERAKLAARSAAAGKRGELRVGFVSCADSNIVPALLRKFHLASPDVGCTLRDIPASLQLKMLQEDTLDIGFVAGPTTQPSGLQSLTVHRERYILAVSSTHPFAGKQISMRDIGVDDFLLPDRSTAPGLYERVSSILRDYDVVPTSGRKSPDMRTMLSMIAFGMGVSLVPESAVRHCAVDVAACEVRESLPCFKLEMVFRQADSSLPAENFRKSVSGQLIY